MLMDFSLYSDAYSAKHRFIIELHAFQIARVFVFLILLWRKLCLHTTLALLHFLHVF